MKTKINPSYLISLGIIISGMAISVNSLYAQIDYENTAIPAYSLPDPLITLDGRPVEDPQTWMQLRRPEILHMFETEMFGIAPGPPERMESKVIKVHTSGKVTYKQVDVELIQGNSSTTMNLLISLPADATGPVPVFMGMNFSGNHTTTFDTSILIPDNYMSTDGVTPIDARGSWVSRWPSEMVTERGYGIVTLPRTGANKLFPIEGKPSDWGSFSQWAWILRRVVDYLETDEQVDQQHIAVVGTSRLGKVALWAGAMDERIGIIIPMCTGGCGGASLMNKRFFGEDTDALNCGIGAGKLCDNFQKYLDNEAVMPFDQHMLLALMAPRPIYIGTAEGQQEPQNLGMFMALMGAEPVYKLLGTDGFGATTMPGLHQPVMTTMGYHIRAGKHGIEEYDWKCFMDFADKHWQNR